MEKCFGEENPLGKTIQIEIDYDIRPVKIQDFVVTGVIKNSPANTHLKYDIFISMATMLSNLPDFNEDWLIPKVKYTYIKLNPAVDVDFLKNRSNRLQKSVLIYMRKDITGKWI